MKIGKNFTSTPACLIADIPTKIALKLNQLAYKGSQILTPETLLTYCPIEVQDTRDK
jgi:hypothetical protein